MKFKKIIALATTATLIVGYGIPAFATEATGAGAVEYDNSVDITYDSFTAPVLTDGKYNFTLDPRDELYTYDKTTYARGEGEKNPGIYFKAEKTAAKIEKLAASDDNYEVLYTLSKTAVAVDAADWKAVVTAIADDEAETPTVTAGYYVWVPADFVAGDSLNGTTATGKKGDYLALSASNIRTYFDISEKDAQDKYTITVKENHLAGDCVYDGKLYKDTYTELAAAIVDNKPTVDIEDYVKTGLNATTKEQEIKEVKNVYTEENGVYTMADKDNIKFTPATASYQAVTDKVVMTNKSTKDKVITAEITMSNISGLAFKGNDTFTGDETASVFFKATDGTVADDKTLSVADGATVATAKFTTEVAGATVTPIKYQGGTNDKTGGHDYFNYEAVGTDYNSSSFWITAKANTENGAAAAWKAYGEALEAAFDAANPDWEEGDDFVSVRPSINIVYTVSNKLSAEEQAAADALEAANAFRTTYNSVITLEAGDLTGSSEEQAAITAAKNAFAGLDDAVKAVLEEDYSIDATFFTDLLAASQAAAITDEVAELQFISSLNKWFVGQTTSVGLSEDTFTIASVTMAKDNGEAVDVSAIASIYEFANSYWIAIDYTEGAELGITYSAGSTYEVVAIIGNTRYTASKTY